MSDVGHTLILGPTGSGKSTLLGLVMAQFFRYPDAQVFLFDKDYSAYVLAHACGADYYDLLGEADQALGFAPLAGVDAAGRAALGAGMAGDRPGPPGGPRHPGATQGAPPGPGAPRGEPLPNADRPREHPPGSRAPGRLHHYTLAGGLGGLLDATFDGLGTGRFQVFEMSHLMALGEKNLVPVLFYLFHRVEQRLRDERPGLLVSRRLGSRP